LEWFLRCSFKKEKMKTLGGFMFVRNGCLYDYCFIESIESMCQNCDLVSVVVIESGDGTVEEVKKLVYKYPNLTIDIYPDSDWMSKRDHRNYPIFRI
jgi:hypothetical protein